MWSSDFHHLFSHLFSNGNLEFPSLLHFSRVCIVNNFAIGCSSEYFPIIFWWTHLFCPLSVHICNVISKLKSTSITLRKEMKSCSPTVSLFPCISTPCISACLSRLIMFKHMSWFLLVSKDTWQLVPSVAPHTNQIMYLKKLLLTLTDLIRVAVYISDWGKKHNKNCFKIISFQKTTTTLSTNLDPESWDSSWHKRHAPLQPTADRPRKPCVGYFWIQAWENSLKEKKELGSWLQIYQSLFLSLVQSTVATENKKVERRGERDQVWPS